MNITTTARFKAFAGITSTSDDARIAALITQFGALLAQRLGFCEATTFIREWVWLDKETSILCPTYYPITAVNTICTHKSAIMRVYNNTASEAFVVVRDSNVVLLATAGGTTVMTTKALATYKTVSDLAAAINAETGWVATVLNNYGDMATADLLTGRPEYARFPYQVTLYRPDLSVLESVARLQSGHIELYNDIVGDVFLNYNAGYSMPTDASDGTLPAGLLFLVHASLADVYSNIGKSADLTSESIGDYSYTRRVIESVLDARAKDFSAYKRKTI